MIEFHGECKEHRVRLELDDDTAEPPFSETMSGSNVWQPDFSFMSCPEFLKELEANEANEQLDRFQERMKWVDEHQCNRTWVMVSEWRPE